MLREATILSDNAGTEEFDPASGSLSDCLENADRIQGFAEPDLAAVRHAEPALVKAMPFGSAGMIRLFDILSATALLLCMLPLLVILAIALQIDSPGPLFFTQQRVGRNGKLFRCIKFRTMCVNADQVLVRHLAANDDARDEWLRNFKLRDDPRVTRLGAIIRRLSFDEFPQLLNIIAGDMSVVGPRPIIRAEIDSYGRHFATYCAVRPGLTGLWQVSGRSDVCFKKRVRLDCYYIARKSLVNDLAIVFRTIPVVLAARGAY